MVRAWRFAIAAACVRVQSSLGAGREMSCFSPLNVGTSIRCLCPLYLTLTCFTRFRWKWVPGRAEMTMCTISSMRRNCCRTVCSTWSLNHTNKQIQWHINLHLYFFTFYFYFESGKNQYLLTLQVSICYLLPLQSRILLSAFAGHSISDCLYFVWFEKK